ncbi:GAF domain-containing protein [Agaribacter marinus]|uniref:GAF domain protein n=1 Tax=Agaribacter marinus TaxID=1431249 RepID=A0AA37SXY8_9ALTE|nr:GAF domain-containing protein [Agaribacter marinus]GLR70140.1 GAF domain protein [Agaribacter marinus]
MDNKSVVYESLLQQIAAVTQGENDIIANLANISSILFYGLDDINWAGFYLYKEEQLVLGPFQGKSACIRIPMGKGVCGTAAETETVQVIYDVHTFDGHIACDSASNSEIVLPIVTNTGLVGVLDIDSPSVGRFDQQDAAGLLPISNLIATLYDIA